MDINTERALYIKKLDSQIQGMRQLLDPKYHEIISDSKAGQITSLLMKAEKLREKLSKNEFEVAIIGLEKAGKSTFANALMGNDILPSMDERCTYTSTCIRYGAEDYAEIVFYSRNEFLQKFTDSLKTMGIEYAEKYDFTTLSAAEYKALFERLPDEKKNLYRASVNKDIECILKHINTLRDWIDKEMKVFRGAEQLEQDEFKKFIYNPAYAIAVKNITIHSSQLYDMQNVVLYDVPGFDSPTQMHRVQTIQMMASADVIILIANAGKPSITGPQVQIFEAETDPDGIPFNEKIFVYGNKADTANDAIEKNIQVLKRELNEYRIVQSGLIESRIVIGSARGRLEKNGKLPDTGLVQKLETKGITDGIDEIHSKLEQYNANERFDVLKKRINRIYSELEECLSPELAELKNVGEDTAHIAEISAIVVQLLSTAQTAIEKELRSLHSDVPRDFQSLPLSAEFIASIGNVNSDVYQITADERKKAKDASSTNGKNISLDKFESILREMKYDQIYNFFIQTVVDVAIEKHREYNEKIRNIFLNALKITPSHPYYDQLVKEIETYLSEINPEGKEGYYRSLGERFTADLFETLIRQNFGGRDRWAAFEERKLNIYSLGVFYTARNDDLPADKQPMLYSILFHDKLGTGGNDAVSELLNIIALYVPGYESGVEQRFAKIVKQLLKEKKETAAEYVTKLCEKKAQNDPLRFMDSVYSYMKTDLDFDDRTIAGNAMPDITRDYYDTRCKDENLNSSDIESVCEHIHHDINILGEILLNAAIPAIQIDKTFVYYVVRCIEKVLNSVTPGEEYRFGEFVKRNTAKIACGQLASIEAEAKKRALRIEMCSEIQKILGNVKNIGEEKE